ncbi:MAG: hypothetical protein RI538_03895 [Salibaculum sp.]|jgi:hypothetical protein|uniref:hypothetical protein n=1 Tax=Roseovarius halophilus (ex Wu et al. 2025) TaxID=3376060 RepID=UPI0028707193|nr:hypothetical protein [Salibaculum sp.]MDR9427091.1 hypothetical protein [Salibaculum sp.]MDR9481910.1 hypothetical protein [Salibaculum sp.]
MRGCFTVLAGVLALGACDEAALQGGDGDGMREYMVLGDSMSFEQCRARGGLIIRDRGSPMVACDPRVVGEPVPPDEFDHPDSPVPQPTADETGGENA